MVAHDAVLLEDTLFVAFVIFGLGGYFDRCAAWLGVVVNPYRYAHLAAIAIVVPSLVSARSAR